MERNLCRDTTSIRQIYSKNLCIYKIPEYFWVKKLTMKATEYNWHHFHPHQTINWAPLLYGWGQSHPDERDHSHKDINVSSEDVIRTLYWFVLLLMCTSGHKACSKMPPPINRPNCFSFYLQPFCCVITLCISIVQKNRTTKPHFPSTPKNCVINTVPTQINCSDYFWVHLNQLIDQQSGSW